MRAHMVFDDLSHEARHGAACASDEVHDLFAPHLSRQSAIDTIDLAANAAYSRQKLLLISNRMAHLQSMPYLPILYQCVEMTERSHGCGGGYSVVDITSIPVISY